GKCDLYFVPRIQVLHLAFGAHGSGHDLGQIVHRVWHVGSNIEKFISRRGVIDALSDDRRHVINVREGPLLGAISEDRHGFAFEDLVHKYAYDVAIAISYILFSAKNVVWAKNNILESKH